MSSRRPRSRAGTLGRALLLLSALIVQVAVSGACVLVVASHVLGAAMGPPAGMVAPERIVGLRILDRNGELLREPLGARGDRGRWVALGELPAHMPLAVLAAEDERFYRHGGIDVASLGRAAVQNAASLRLVSGASTVTQQLVKLASGGIHSRTPRQKLFEMAASLHFERHLGKDEILEAYLNWVPYGHLTRGVGMASRTYFGKPAAHLTLSESAALAALLRGPGYLDPYDHPERLEQRRLWVLARMHENGWIDGSELAHAGGSAPVFLPPRPAFHAPHLADEILRRTSQDRLASGRITTTLDLGLQEKVETLCERAVEGLRPLDVSNAAVVVIDNDTAEVLAWVGSSRYFDEADGGMNDGVTARRSPGSALKPFVYAEALERGFTPASLFEDVETSFETPEGPYRPRNYDGRYHGPVLLRQALGSSLNVPAVWLAARLGPGNVLDALHRAGFDSLDRDASHYGAAIALGDGEVTLLELAAAYSALARGGLYRVPVLVRSVEDAGGRPVPLSEPPARRMTGPVTAHLVTDILSDPAARAPEFGQARVLDAGYPVAVKTGTSHDYRDSWTVGYSSEVTVAVWVGNFDGRPMGNIAGVSGAGPLFRAVMDLAMSDRTARAFPVPSGTSTVRVCSLSGALPGPGCGITHEEVFAAGTEPGDTCPFHRVLDVDLRTGEPAGPGVPDAFTGSAVFETYPESLLEWAMQAGRPLAPLAGKGPTPAMAGTLEVLQPADGARFTLSPDVPAGMQVVSVRLLVPAGAGSVVLVVDGEEAGTLDGPPWSLEWPLEPGTHVLLARAGGLVSSPVTLHVE